MPAAEQLATCPRHASGLALWKADTAGMREIFARMAELEREGRRFAVATVVRTIGSTSQVVGDKLLVDDLGRLVGTLGGGCVEGDAFVEAKRVIQTNESSLREYELTADPEWDTGIVCGGTMW